MANYGSIGVYRNALASISGLMPTTLSTIIPGEDLYSVIIKDRKLKSVVLQDIIVSANTQNKAIKGTRTSQSVTGISGLMPTSLSIVNNSPYGLLKFVPMWAYNTANMFPNTTGKITGTVKVEGILWANIEVRLYYKTNGFFIGYTKTNELGEFAFYNLEVGSPLYYVVAFKDTFNAVVLDGIAPVPM